MISTFLSDKTNYPFWDPFGEVVAELASPGIAINEKGCIFNLRMTRNDSKRIHGSDNGITNTRIHMHVKYVCPHENEVIAG